MNLDGANETDVREDIASPFLAALGYQRGTEADILREFGLSYDRVFLGRKKANDPPLRGRADYVLSVLGAGRWVLEVKAPGEPLDLDVVEQALSYARHPRVSGSYVALLNGRRFLLYHNSQASDAPPLLDIDVIDPQQLAATLMGTLSPAAIRRDCSPPRIDLQIPIGPGLRSRAEIANGYVQHNTVEMYCNLPIMEPHLTQSREQAKRLQGMRSPIVGGEVWRDEHGRIRAKIVWDAPHQELLDFARSKGLMEVEYVGLGPAAPLAADQDAIFEVVGGITVHEGESLFDLRSWTSVVVGTPMNMNFRGQVVGRLAGSKFKGQFEVEYEMRMPAMPDLIIATYLTGEYGLTLVA